MEVEFRQLFTERFGCSAEEFEERVFWRALFRHALPFAWLISRLKPSFFREDYDLLREVATARNTGEVVSELNRFYGRNARDKSVLRTELHLRVSGKRVLRLYRDLTRDQEEADEDQPALAKQG
jgi:hypothetical protein